MTDTESQLDMSLGDIIAQKSKASKSTQGKKRQNRGGSGRGFGGGGSNSRVYVGNLSWSVTWQTLKDHMRSAGDVVRADVLEGRDGKSRGCGIVEYATASDARRAIEELTDTDLEGRDIFVREDREEKGRGRAEEKSGARTRGGGGGGSNTRVYVGNLSWSVTWQTLKDHMRSAGDVVRADVLEGRDGKSRGCGIVEYATARDARRAIQELTDTDLEGRDIFVREDREERSGTRPSRARSRSPGRGGGGRGGGGGGRLRDGDTSRVYVGNLSWSVTWQTLKDHMRSAGDVMRADIIAGRDGKSRGCGIVEYATARQARRAIEELTDSDLEGRNIFVREDREERGVGLML